MKTFIFLVLLLSIRLSLCSINKGNFSANVTVAQDGIGNFSRIGDALKVAPNFSLQIFVIFIKAGVYHEYVKVDETKWNIVMIGEGMDTTIITGDRSNRSGWKTMESATFAVEGKGFIAMNLGFQNTAGPNKYQAVAFRSSSNNSALYNCSFSGYQDTLYVRPSYQFYRECRISGTVDFIFGEGSAMFQNCDIIIRKGLPKQRHTISAQGRAKPRDASGFSFQFCNILADSSLLPYLNLVSSYLGRPWKPHSRIVFMQSYLSGVISPKGWLEFSGSAGLDTLYFAKYMNRGPSARIDDRINWTGYHVLKNLTEVEAYTVAKFLSGNLWLPNTGVPYVGGLV